jgi:lia operon protein LiaG
MSHPLGPKGIVVLMPALALVTIAFSGGDLGAQSDRKERFTLEGDDVAIYNLAGEIRVEPGSGSSVVVEVDRAGPDASHLRVETGHARGAQTLRVIYPASRVVYPAMGRGRSRCELDVAPDGTFGNDRGLGFLTGKRRVTITSSGGGMEAWADVRVIVPRGQKLRLQWGAGAAEIGGVEGDVSFDNARGPITARGAKGRLKLDTGSSDVMVKDIEGDLWIDTGSGGITLDGLRGGELTLDTGSGDIQASDVDADKVLGDTGSGRISMEGVRATTVRLDTGSGDVDLELRSDVENLHVDTGSGSVRMIVPSRLGAEFEIETGSGGIDVDVPHQTISVERNHVRGRFGDGRGRIHVDTGSGGVRVLRRSTTSERSSSLMGIYLVPRIG